MTDKYIFHIIIALLVVNVILSAVKLLKKDKSEQLKLQIKNLGDEIEEYTDKSKKDTLDFLARQQSLQNQNRQNVQIMEEARFKAFNDTTQDNIDTLRKTVNEMAKGIDDRFANFQKQNEDQLSEMRKTLEQKVSDMQQSNEKKLDEYKPLDLGEIEKRTAQKDA